MQTLNTSRKKKKICTLEYVIFWRAKNINFRLFRFQDIHQSWHLLSFGASWGLTLRNTRKKMELELKALGKWFWSDLLPVFDRTPKRFLHPEVQLGSASYWVMAYSLGVVSMMYFSKTKEWAIQLENCIDIISMFVLWPMQVLFCTRHLLLYVCTAFLLATQLNYLHEQNLLVPQCICMLKRSVATTMKDGRYYLILLFSPCLLSCTVNLLSGCNPAVIHAFTFSGQFLVSLTWRLFSQQRILGVSLEVPFNIKGQVRLHKLCARSKK